jgi:hypothetical protein
MTDLTFEQIESAVRELASENPEFVYDQGSSPFCKYNPNHEQPGCIFGQAFIALGEPVPSQFDPTEGSELEAGIIRVLEYLGIETTVRQRAWADAVQSNQDMSYPWQRAVERGDRFTNKYFPEH